MTTTQDSPRFLSTLLERLGRIETSWYSLSQGLAGDELAHELMRDLHTLKGDASLLGFEDAVRLCQELEGLVEYSADVRYDVGDEIELLVAMALQFTGLLLRAQPGAPPSGIDVPGFLAQVRQSLARARALFGRDVTTSQRDPSSTTMRSALTTRRSALTTLQRVSIPTLQRLGVAAAAAFVEYCNASGHSRLRLRNLWLLLRNEAVELGSTPLAPLIARYASGAEALATSLGKSVRVEPMGEADVGVPTSAFDAVDTALAHILRNAIDHGIEHPAARSAAGKPPQGTVQVKARRTDSRLELIVEDDGHGVDFDAVEQVARSRGVLDARSETTDHARLTALLFDHGFSTRAQAEEVSGRGIGLDAVKAAITRLGGSVRLESQVGVGTTVTVSLPTAMSQMEVKVFRCPGSPVHFACAAEWETRFDSSPSCEAIDLRRAIRIGSTTRNRELSSGVLHLVRGRFAVQFQASTPATPALARRSCPTSDRDAIEVVNVDGKEVLLVRPNRVLEIADL